ncbi:hypothetical protein BD324DRAFT_428879 [Kockovaella imperatae]|uniref:Uncharacterized protein n=1 Tax=Kockovaella imperatae TaxID=4999 RepID=A0A1Y1UGG0_9TREE|nr:hypothetical protein BD324DRAFT_428879 [Kockovaella imperatae]ORX37151.1 hypothetical protein BD324DRAFT_428879 [Kockovaella imperatae]
MLFLARRVAAPRIISCSRYTPLAFRSNLHSRSTFSTSSLCFNSDSTSPPVPQVDLLTDIIPVKLSRDQLLRLHKLSALNAPPEGSEEEAKLLDGLGELIGLMELVKSVELEGDVGELLAEGVGEVVIDGSEPPKPTDSSEVASQPAPSLSKPKSGRELLGWATRKVGDFYAHRIETRE